MELSLPGLWVGGAIIAWLVGGWVELSLPGLWVGGAIIGWLVSHNIATATPLITWRLP